MISEELQSSGFPDYEFRFFKLRQNQCLDGGLMTSLTPPDDCQVWKVFIWFITSLGYEVCRCDLSATLYSLSEWDVENIHPSIFFCLSKVSGFGGCTLFQMSSPQFHFPSLLGGNWDVLGTDGIYNPPSFLGLSQCLCPVRRTWKASNERYRGGILSRCLNHLICILLILKNSNSSPSSLWIAWTLDPISSSLLYSTAEPYKLISATSMILLIQQRQIMKHKKNPGSSN